MGTMPKAPVSPPSLNADLQPGKVDRSVSTTIDVEHPDEVTVRVNPTETVTPILVFTLDARSAETVLRGVRALRRNPALRRHPHDADELNRVDKIASACERAIAIYWDWVEERSRAAKVGQLEEDARREHQRDDQVGAPAEAGGGRGLRPAAQE